MRSLAREAVFKYTFSKLFNLNDEGLFDVLCKDLSNEDKEFATKLLNGIDNSLDKFNNALESLSKGYSLNRIFNTDKCALLVGFSELNVEPETPVAIVIDETVKLAAKYSTEKSTDFVNGVLAQYVKTYINK